MNYKPLFAMLFSIPLVFSPALVHANEVSAEVPMPAPVATTSTEPLLTPPLPVAAVTSSVTVVATTTIAVLPSSSSTTPVTVAPTSSPPSVTLPVTPSSTATSTMLCLAIIEPAPLQGLEWVAFYGLTPSTTDALLNWTLADAQGSLLKFSQTSALLWDEASKTIRIELKSSRLNNDGDTVTLKNPLNEKHDEFIYPGVEKGERWMRDSCLSPWHRSPERVVPTPTVAAPTTTPSSSSPSTTTLESVASSSTGTVVTLPADEEPTMTVTSQSLPSLPTPLIEEPTTTESLNSESPTEEPPTFFVAVPPAATVQEETAQTTERETVTIKPAVPLPKESVTVQTASVKTKTTKKTATKSSTAKTASIPKKAAAKSTTKTAAKKTTAKKSASTKKAKTSTTPSKSVSPISSFTMSPLLADPQTFQGIRVRVIGRVASEKDLLGAHRYVIVNEDGRGLIIHANSKQLSPTLGSLIEVTGTVVWNDEGLWLKQTTTDLWQSASSSNQLSYAQLPKRSVSLVSPSQEDAWSLVTTEGVVSAVQKSSFDIDVDGTVVRVKISSKLGYRAGRLQAGDQVRVQGLLDTRQGESILVPQSVEAIQILGRASVANPSPKVPVTHPWLPVGAAAGTLGLSEGWRRFRDRQKRRREEASFKALVSPSLREE